MQRFLFLLLLGGSACLAGPNRFDDNLSTFMTRWNLPGGAFALAKDGHLIYARGYGFADRDARQPVEPDSLFRIGSTSKPITAAGILKLVEAGRLNLDTPVFDLLPEYREALGDARALAVTVRQLLNHTSGFMPGENGFPTPSELQSMGVPLPPAARDALPLLLSQPLLFAPGTQYSYSNVGYMLLGALIERVSGMPYAAFIQQRVLGPLGIHRMQLGAGLLRDRAIGEAVYYDYPGAPQLPPYYPAAGSLAPIPYGSDLMEVMWSAGAWLASPIDLLRFLTALDGTRGRLLKAPTIEAMQARPSAYPPDAAGWYGLGWVIQTQGETREWWHNGGMPGTSSMVIHTVTPAGVLDFAACFNSKPEDTQDDAFYSDLVMALSDAIANTTEWPSEDLFPAYFESQSPRIFGGGVVNAASYEPKAVAPGELLYIYGSHLSRFGAASVTINGAPARVLWATPDRLAVVAPSSLGSSETADVAVGHSAAARVRVAPLSPGVFTLSGKGYGRAAYLTLQGGAMDVYATGLPAGPVTVLLGGKTAPGQAGAFPGMPGLVRVRVRISGDVPSGELSLVLQSGQASSQPGVTVNVR